MNTNGCREGKPEKYVTRPRPGRPVRTIAEAAFCALSRSRGRFVWRFPTTPHPATPSPSLRAWDRHPTSTGSKALGCQLRHEALRQSRHARNLESGDSLSKLDEAVINIHSEVLAVLDEALSLKGRSAAFSRETLLLGAIPELDSMAVVSLLTALEDRFGIAVDDDDIDGDTFASVGSLVDFVAGKVAA